MGARDRIPQRGKWQLTAEATLWCVFIASRVHPGQRAEHLLSAPRLRRHDNEVAGALRQLLRGEGWTVDSNSYNYFAAAEDMRSRRSRSRRISWLFETRLELWILANMHGNGNWPIGEWVAHLGDGSFGIPIQLLLQLLSANKAQVCQKVHKCDTIIQPYCVISLSYDIRAQFFQLQLIAAPGCSWLPPAAPLDCSQCDAKGF